MDPERRRLLDTIRHRYDIVAHSHKAHEKERELIVKRVARQKWFRLVLTILNSTFVGGGVLAAVGTNYNPAALPTIAAGITALVAIILLTSTPENIVHTHKTAAKLLLRERNQLLLLIEKSMSRDYSNQVIREHLYSIEQRLDAIEPLLPPTSNKAYKLARAALATGSERASEQSDIDKILPKGLRDGETTSTTNESSDESDDTDFSKLIDYA